MNDELIRIPVRAEGPDGLTGDGMIEIGPDDDRYQQWDTWLASTDGGSPPSPD